MIVWVIICIPAWKAYVLFSMCLIFQWFLTIEGMILIFNFWAFSVADDFTFLVSKGFLLASF